MTILITPKINPDLDGVACALAYADFLNNTDKANIYVAGIYGQPHAEARFLLEKLNINDGLIFDPKMEFDKYIIVDASDTKGMPEVIRPQDVIEVIDHRQTHRAEELFPNAKIQIESVGAAATLIFEKMREVKFSINSDSLYLLLGAIFSNTLNFKSDIATERDLKTVESLSRDYGVVIPPNLIEDMFQYKTEYIANNLEEVIASDFKTFDGGLGIAQLEGFDLQNLIGDKIENIKEVLKKIKEKHNLEYIFLTAADIKNGYNIFVAIDEKTQSLLSQSIDLSFDDQGTAKNDKLLLRKQLLPLLIKGL